MAQILQFRSRPKKRPAPPHKKRRGVYLSVLVWVALVAGIALLNPDFRSKELGIPEIAPVRLAISQRFDFCGWNSQSFCVIDGDTIRYAGIKIRIADIDTPEIHHYKCDDELERGLRAKSRLLELINAGPFEIVHSGGRDEDQYGRKLRRIVRNGLSLGELLVDEGLARRYAGGRRSWCL
jgi:micrococcal nuclease